MFQHEITNSISDLECNHFKACIGMDTNYKLLQYLKKVGYKSGS